MDTPIYDFVSRYAAADPARLHMPGHKGQRFLGCEERDLTEVKGADSLYEAAGIIAASEANAAALFGTGATFYSTEGSSQCIRAMLYLARMQAQPSGRATVVAGRNAHKSFILACALLDLDVVWLWPEDEQFALCRCPISSTQLQQTLAALPEPPLAVYVTSPDYLGQVLDIRALADTAHQYGVPLLVDNAHGAYQHFLPTPAHPLDLGADLCCDSAHKTLPVLTGGAYLQIAPAAPPLFRELARQALILFGSTSPSYLILQSLDLANRYLAAGYREQLAACVEALAQLKAELTAAGWQLADTEPLKLTIEAAASGWPGPELAERLRQGQVECEFADPDFVMLMLTPENGQRDRERLRQALLTAGVRPPLARPPLPPKLRPRQRCTARQALLALPEMLPAEAALGRTLALPTVGCPPAVPVLVCGEEIDQDALAVFRYYGLEQVSVLRES